MLLEACYRKNWMILSGTGMIILSGRILIFLHHMDVPMTFTTCLHYMVRFSIEWWPFTSDLTGTEDQSQPFSCALWARSMLQESTAPPPLYPPVFQHVAEAVLRVTMGLTICDVSVSNCRDVYVRLVFNFECIFTNGFFNWNKVFWEKLMIHVNRYVAMTLDQNNTTWKCCFHETTVSHSY